MVENGMLTLTLADIVIRHLFIIGQGLLQGDYWSVKHRNDREPTKWL